MTVSGVIASGMAERTEQYGKRDNYRDEPRPLSGCRLLKTLSGHSGSASSGSDTGFRVGCRTTI